MMSNDILYEGYAESVSWFIFLYLFLNIFLIFLFSAIKYWESVISNVYDAKDILHEDYGKPVN